MFLYDSDGVPIFMPLSKAEYDLRVKLAEQVFDNIKQENTETMRTLDARAYKLMAATTPPKPSLLY
jgi:hypothetical protein